MFLTFNKKKATYIRQLALKKYRLKEKAFPIEGRKLFQEVVNSPYTIQCIVGTPKFFSDHHNMIQNLGSNIELFKVSSKVLSSLGSLNHNHDVMAIVNMPLPDTVLPKSGLILALNDIQDPGNLGTIIRIADWYNIKTILCSTKTVDLYNPKVLQASMGSFLHIKLYYINLAKYLEQTTLPIIGATTCKGIPIHKVSFPKHGILVIGNESHGIHDTIKKSLTQSITIPKYGQAESLNAAIATAIICEYWKKSLHTSKEP